MNNKQKSERTGKIRICFSSSNLIFYILAVLPPNIFMFHLYTRNAEFVDYWHIFILSILLSIGGLFLFWIISRIGKSLQASALVCIFLWIMFFTLRPIYQNFPLLYFSDLSAKIRIIIILIAVLIFSVLIFFIGRRIKYKEIFKIFAVFTIVVFMINFFQATYRYILEKSYIIIESNYKTYFIIDDASLTPNIYWLHMDGMLGFKAMEHFFYDSQIEFESRLKEKGFIVNRDAEFEADSGTIFAIPALMSPFFYDTVMAPILISINPSMINRKGQVFKI